MKQKKRWILYSLNFFVFAAISMVNTQIIPYLGKVGYDVVDRGYILAGSAIVAIIGQFLFGYLCDRFKRLKPFFLLAYGFMIAGSIMMFIIHKQLFYYHLFAVSLSGGMVKVIMGLNETWMLEVDEENYGRLRAAGALGLTIGSPIAGSVIHAFGYNFLLFMLIGVSICLLFFFWKSVDAQKKKSEHVRLESLKELLTNRLYLLLVLIYLMIYMIGTADQYVVIDKMLAIGADTSAVGIKWAVQSFMEVPLFLFASAILKRVKPGMLLLFGTVMYGWRRSTVTQRSCGNAEPTQKRGETAFTWHLRFPLRLAICSERKGLDPSGTWIDRFPLLKRRRKSMNTNVLRKHRSALSA